MEWKCILLWLVYFFDKYCLCLYIFYNLLVLYVFICFLLLYTKRKTYTNAI